MKRLILSALLASAFALPAYATMKVGDTAPDFTLQASEAGKEFTFSLSDALKKGPVVVYFYPKAFTHGCSIEAHDFAEAIDQYHSLGATVIGVSHDDIATLDKFSVQDCQSKFPVAADTDGKVMNAWDTEIPLMSMANRTSYVVAPGGKIILEYTDMSPDHHVEKTLNAVKLWRVSR
jgi:peroxiredoxin (alkyl hydroperoxide reductase subunit C)